MKTKFRKRLYFIKSFCNVRLILIFTFLFNLSFIQNCSLAFLNTNKPRDRNDLPIRITHIRGSVYLVEDFNYIKTSSVVFVNKEGIVFFDSGWTYKSARQIIWQASQISQSDFIAIVPTSFDLNRTGGLSTFKATRIKILMQKNTPKLLYRHWTHEQKKMKSRFGTWRVLEYQSPDALFDASFEFFKGKIQLFHFGPGTTPDNVVVYFRDEKLVYAGNLLSVRIPSKSYLNKKGYRENIKHIQKLDFKDIIDGRSGKLYSKDQISDLW